jgi:hypothetical protein
MGQLKNLKLIYHFGQDQNSDIPELSGNYQILYFISEDEIIDLDFIIPFFETCLQKPTSIPIQFSSFEDLKKVALSLCIGMKAAEMFLISSQDYNLALQSVQNPLDLKESFRRYGLTINNEEVLGKSRGGWLSSLSKIKDIGKRKD